MNKKLLVVILIVTAMFCRLSAEQKVVNLSYSAGDFEFFTTTDGTQIKYNGNQHIVYSNVPGAPNLPNHIVMVSVPDGAQYQELLFSYNSVEVRSDAIISPAQHEILTSNYSNDIPMVDPDPLYYTVGEYPENLCTYVSTQKMGPYRLFCFQISPFIYYPLTNQLKLITTCTITIDYTLTDFSNDIRWDDRSIGVALQQMVANPVDLVVQDDRPPIETDVKYMIITKNLLVSNFQPLADWKTKKGIKTQIVTVESILSNPSFQGSTPEEKIKSCIKYYYEQHHTKWVLLGGNTDVVPSRICYSHVTLSGLNPPPPEAFYVQSDLYYACFDNNFQWNQNNNAIYGEIDDNIDFAPEVIIGRAAVLDANINTFVQKTLAYEQTPPSSNFANQALMIGSRVDMNINDGYYQNLSHTQWHCEDLWSNHMYPYWPNSNRSRFYDTTNDFGQFTTNNLISTINTGYNVIFESSHGNSSMWDFGPGVAGVYFNTNNVNSITNGSRQGLLYSIACETNHFEANTGSQSLGSSFIERSGGGSVVYIGNTGLGITYRLIPSNISNSGPSYSFAKSFFPGLLSATNTINSSVGDCFKFSKAQHLGMIGNTYNSWRHIMFGLNLQGDPELNLLTANPTTMTVLHPQYFFSGSNSSNYPLVIEVGLSNALVCISNGVDVYTYGYTNQNGSISFSINTQSTASLTITVTAKNKLPYTNQIQVRPIRLHGTVALNTIPNDVILSRIRLYNSATNLLVTESTPISNGEYVFGADPGQYYLEYELFQPSINKFYYPVKTNQINIASGTSITEMPLVTLTKYYMNAPKVSSSTSYPYFKTIGQALQRIQTAVNGGYNGNTVTLDVFPGNYYWPQTNSQPVGNFGYTNAANNALALVIRGAGNGAIIEPQYDDYYTLNINRTNISFQNIKFSRAANNWNYYLTFHGTNNSSYSFTGCLFGKHDFNMHYKSSVSFAGISGITFYNCSIQSNDNTVYGDGILKFENCSNIDLNNCNFTQNMSFFGGAIYLSESSNVQVRNSLFEYNNSIAPEFEIPVGIPGGAIYIKLSTNVRIDSNRFINNFTTGGGGAVYFKNTSIIHIENNLFKDNISQPVGSIIPTPSDALGFNNCTFSASDILLRNIIHSGFEQNTGYDNDFIVIGRECSGTLNITNGVFIKGSFDNNNWKKIVRSFSPVNMNFTNCVFQTRDVDVDFSYNSYPPQPTLISVSYSLFDNDFTGVTNANHNSCQISDMRLDSNYVPIWSQTTMSPCIDSGDPNSPKDPDGTPADIGAIPAATHAFWDYTFRKSSAYTQPNYRSDTWHWVSYPVINSVTQGKRVARSFFTDLLGTHPISPTENEPDVLQTIWWKENNTDHFIEWDDQNNSSDWSDETDTHQLSSPQGYKIKLLPLGDPIPVNYPSVVLHHSGFPTSSTSTFTIHGSDVANDQIYENWIGYFDTECQWPQDAFASIWNDIIFIKAKDWCLYRSNRNNNFSAIEGTMLPMKCGDMVVVATYSAHDEFQWETSNPVVPIEKEKATYFTYEEKPDYTPVELSLSGIDKTDLKEIALKLNGICKGAVVVKNDVEQLCAYLDVNEKLTEGTVELIFYYESKSQPQELKSINIDRTNLSSNSMGGVSAYPIYYISVTPNDMTDNTVPVLSLEQNYPNPFNPTTIIKYSLDEPGAVSLEIYNIKGQLVKTLIQGNADKGTHSVVWDGIDHTGNPCSSGVYFYKLRTNSRFLVRKMLMLK